MSKDVDGSLYKDDDLEITFRVDDDVARVDLVSNPRVYDLTASDDVVVVINGRGAEVKASDAGHAVAMLGHVGSLGSAQLMVRVHEFFEGWEVDLAYTPGASE